MATPTPPSQAPSPAPAPPAMRATWTTLTVSYGGRWIFRDFSYAVPDGGVVGLVGPSGPDLAVGLLALTGRYRPVTGTVEILDAPASVVVASACTGDHYDPLLTVAEVVAETSQSSSESTDTVTWALTAVGLQDRVRARVADLVGTERMSLALAAAAANGASVIAVDLSPIAGDPGISHIWTLIAQLAASGRLLLVASPVPHESMNLVLPIPHSPEVAS